MGTRERTQVKELPVRRGGHAATWTEISHRQSTVRQHAIRTKGLKIKGGKMKKETGGTVHLAI